MPPKLRVKKKDASVQDPVTTTKALMVIITSPRKLSTKPVDEETKETARSSSNSSEMPPVPLGQDAEREYSQEVTEEEIAAIRKSDFDPQVDSVVDIEELLRIAFHKLALEWHLLNVPTFQRTVRFLTPQTEPDESLNFRIEPDEPKEEKDEWIQVNVMVRTASLEIVMKRLERIGVGVHCGTLTVVQSELCRTASPLAHHPPNESGDEPEMVNERTIIDAARKEWKNAATRLRIEQVREQIVEQSSFSLDFIALLSVASVLAAIALITDNTVVIVASMLVSPIMGPVLGLTFGTRTRDWPLVFSSLWHESLALLGCVVIGALVGLPAAFTRLADEDWPTNEMLIRGDAVGLLTGIAIAIPSGMGVSLSVLGGNQSSLVGVAISASLLPPAVNTGVCLMYAFLLQIKAVSTDKDFDFAAIGGISFALTVLNIFCIWIAGLLMFGIKEVAPTKEKNAFWARDLKVAAELNQSPNPAPINVSVLQQGLQTAMHKHGKDKKVKIRAPRRKYIAQPDSFRRKKALWGSADTSDEENNSDDVEYVELAQMVALLGFNKDDDEEYYDEESKVTYARNYGHELFL